MNTGPLVNAAYVYMVKRRSCMCPICQTGNVWCVKDEGEDLDIVPVTADTLYQKMECRDCHATWTDVFRLTGYRELSEGPK